MPDLIRLAIADDDGGERQWVFARDQFATAFEVEHNRHRMTIVQLKTGTSHLTWKSLTQIAELIEGD